MCYLSVLLYGYGSLSYILVRKSLTLMVLHGCSGLDYNCSWMLFCYQKFWCSGWPQTKLANGFYDFSILWTLKRSNPRGEEVHPQKKKAIQIIINSLVITSMSYLLPRNTVFESQFLSLDDITIGCLVITVMLLSLQ